MLVWHGLQQICEELLQPFTPALHNESVGEPLRKVRVYSVVYDMVGWHVRKGIDEVPVDKNALLRCQRGQRFSCSSTIAFE